MSLSDEQIEVWRAAHELRASHGHNARAYALRMAERALAGSDLAG